MTGANISRNARPIALLIHGLSGSNAEMEPLKKFLEQRGFDCIAPMLKGHGTSVQDLKRIRLQEWLDQLDQILFSQSQTNFVVCGLSFGALLSLHLALKFQPRCSALIMLSPPWQLRDQASEILLKILSALPDPFLDLLPSIPKADRPLSLREGAYKRHAIGSAVRVVRLRNQLLRSVHKLKIPTLTIYDSSDHHLNPRSFLRPELKELKTIDLKGGAHELTLGSRADEAFGLIEQFLAKQGLCPAN